MRGLQITLFIIAIVSLSAQLIHYSYKRLFWPATSVLDKKIKKDINKTESFESLVEKHKSAKVKLDEFKKGKSKQELKKINKYQHPLYSAAREYRSAISTWERNERKRTKMIFYWVGGLLFFILGALVYHKTAHHWIGMSFVIAGITEMIWWSSPSFSYVSTTQLGYLLNAQILLSILTLALVLMSWLFKEGFKTATD